MAGECCRRSESRCMTSFLFNPITYDTNLKPFVHLPKERPAQNRAGLSFGKLEDKLETPSGADYH